MKITAERRFARGVAQAVALLALALPAWGMIPQPARVEKAIAETNAASGRSDAVKLEVVLSIGDRKQLASGELVSHPSGLARLELRATAGGIVERHLLRGSEHRVARNGEEVLRPRAFLPPFFLLQADTPETLDAALLAFGVDGSQIGLAPCGDLDCFVFGDPRIAAPLPPLPPLPGLEHYQETEDLLDRAVQGLGDEADYLDASKRSATGEAGSGPQAEGGGSDGAAPSGPFARLWVDMKSYEVRRIDLQDGVEVELGPLAVFDRLRVPAWFLIREPGREAARFDVLGATQVNAPPRAFDLDWLMAPVEVPPMANPAAEAEPGDEARPTPPAAPARPAAR